MRLTHFETIAGITSRISWSLSRVIRRLATAFLACIEVSKVYFPTTYLSSVPATGGHWIIPIPRWPSRATILRRNRVEDCSLAQVIKVLGCLWEISVRLILRLLIIHYGRSYVSLILKLIILPLINIFRSQGLPQLFVNFIKLNKIILIIWKCIIIEVYTLSTQYFLLTSYTCSISKIGTWCFWGINCFLQVW